MEDRKDVAWMKLEKMCGVSWMKVANGNALEMPSSWVPFHLLLISRMSNLFYINYFKNIVRLMVY